MPTKDPDLQAFVRENSPVAFRRLLDRHVDAVHSTARRVLGDRCDLAEDVAQLVFLRLASKAHALPDTIVVGAWLHRQTVRLALNTVRTETRRSRREQRSVEFQSIDAMSNDLPEPTWTDVLPDVDQAILELGDRDREALALRFQERKKLSEIADRFGITTAALEKRIARALEKLRSRLARRGITLSAAVIGAMLAKHAVEAAPPTLATSIAAAATQHLSTATTSTLIHTLTAMSLTKALILGSALGLLVGGVWATRAPTPLPLTSEAAESEEARTPSLSLLSKRAPDSRWSIPVPGGTPEEIFNQLQHILESPDNEITRLRLRGFLESLSTEQCADLLAATEDSLNSIDRTRVLPLLASAWILTDPEAAMQGLITTKGSMTAGWYAGNLLFTAFGAWDQHDPSAAQRWLVENQNEKRFEEHVPELIAIVSKSLAVSSEDHAFTWAAQLEGEDYRAAALSAIWSRFTEDPKSTDHTAEIPRLIEKFQQFDDPELAQLATRRFGHDWAKFRTKEFEDWLDQQEPSPFAYQLATGAASVFMAERYEGLRHYNTTPSDRAESAARALRLAGDRPESEVVAELIQGMPAMSGSLTKWALPKLQGADLDNAILHAAEVAFALRMWVDDSSGAEIALDWAVHHSEPADRDALIEDVYTKWLTNGRYSGARDFVVPDDWPEESRSVITRIRSETN